MQLGSKEVPFEPMTWKTQKTVMQLIAKGSADLVISKGLLVRLIAAVGGGQQVDATAIIQVLLGLPELLTDILALGLGVDKDDIEAATGQQVMLALETFVVENALAEQMMRTKKVFSLLAVATGQQGAPEQAGK